MWPKHIQLVLAQNMKTRNKIFQCQIIDKFSYYNKLNHTTIYLVRIIIDANQFSGMKLKNIVENSDI